MKKLLALLLVSALLVSVAEAAVLFDHNAQGTTTASATLPVTMTVSGSNTYLFVCVHAEKSGGVGINTGTTFNGVAMSEIADIAISGTNHQVLWGLKNPSVGTFNIVTTWDSALDRLMIAAVSFTGVDQTNPLRSQGGPFANGVVNNDTSGTSNGPMTVTVPSIAGDLVVDCASPFFAQSPSTVGAGQTRVSQADDTATSGSWEGMSSKTATSTSTTMTWTLNAVPRNWASIGVSINPASGGGGPPPPGAVPKGAVIGVYP